MKKKFIYISLLLLTALPFVSQGQMVVSDPTRDFRQTLEMMETKFKWAEDKAHYYQNILQLKKHLQELEETKELIDKGYNLSEKLYEEAMRYKSLADAGIPELIYSMETVIEMPLNPAHYIPNLGGSTREFKNLVEYKAGSQMSTDAKVVISDILAKSETLYRIDPETGEETAYKTLRVTEAFNDLLDFSSSLKSARKQAIADAIAMQLALAEELESMSKSMTKELLEEENLNLSNAERMNLLLTCTDMSREAKVLRDSAIEQMEAEVAGNIMNEEIYENCNRKAINYNFTQVFLKSAEYQSKDQHYSLYEYEKRYRPSRKRR